MSQNSTVAMAQYAQLGFCKSAYRVLLTSRYNSINN